MTDIIARGQQAQRLLEDEVLADAFRHVEAGLIEEWRATNHTASDTREALWARLRGLEDVQRALRTFLQDAEIALQERRNR